MASTTQEFLVTNPICCFCGGHVPATSRDHQPARIIFPDRYRPQGLEFPACRICNVQSTGAEALLALLCRFAGSRRDNAAQDLHRLKDIVRSVERAYPGLLGQISRGLMARQRGLLVRTAALDVNHPAIYEGMCRVGAKLALATYYAERGKPASASAVINCQWSHSQHSTNVFNSVKTLLTALQNQRDLKQGEWVTTDTFYLKYSDEGTLLIAAIFHESVALLASVHESRQAFNASGERLWHHLMAPSPGNGIVKLI